MSFFTKARYLKVGQLLRGPGDDRSVTRDENRLITKVEHKQGRVLVKTIETDVSGAPQMHASRELNLDPTFSIEIVLNPCWKFVKLRDVSDGTHVRVDEIDVDGNIIVTTSGKVEAGMYGSVVVRATNETTDTFSRDRDCFKIYCADVRDRPQICDAIPDDLLCILCKDLLHDPIQTPSGERACSKCWKTATVPSNGQVCPISGVFTTRTDAIPDNYANNKVKRLKCKHVKQYRSSDGVQECKWQGTLEDFPKHLNECEFVEKMCKICGKNYVCKLDHIKNDRCLARNLKLSDGPCGFAIMGCTGNGATCLDSNHLLLLASFVLERCSNV